MQGFPIDLATVNWSAITVLAVIVFVASLIGALLSFRRSLLAAIITTVLFVAGCVFVAYYPHGLTVPKIIPAAEAKAG
jgi:hypothetical protein